MKNKILFGLCLLSGLMFINSGLNKFLNYIPVPPDLPEKLVKMDQAIKEIGWLIPLVASVEILGGILLIVPRTRLLGALMLFPILVGVLFIHASALPSSLALPLVMFAIVLWVFFENKSKLLPLIQNQSSQPA